jgi:hypothetical protein
MYIQSQFSFHLLRWKNSQQLHNLFPFAFITYQNIHKFAVIKYHFVTDFSFAFLAISLLLVSVIFVEKRDSGVIKYWKWKIGFLGTCVGFVWDFWRDVDEN